MTVTNRIGEEFATYMATATTPQGSTITVSPKILVFRKKSIRNIWNEKKSMSIT